MTTSFGGPIQVAVLFGGTSSEREVSVRSGNAVIEALSARGHRVTPVDLGVAGLPDLGVCDCAFIALHGGAGEDGTIQAALEARGVPYTGSGPAASRLALDKAAAKRAFRAAGIPVARDAVVEASTSPDRARAAAAGVGYPVVVKPSREGSSIGISIVRRAGDLAPALAAAFKCGPEVVIEAFVAGEEYTVAVLDDAALPPIRLVPARPFYDYTAKYRDSGTRYEVADGPDERPIKVAGLAAHRALGCAGFSRVDVIVGADGPVVLEVNTIPGLTERSLLPKAARAAGIEFPELCERMVRHALSRRPAAHAGGR